MNYVLLPAQMVFYLLLGLVSAVAVIAGLVAYALLMALATVIVRIERRRLRK